MKIRGIKVAEFNYAGAQFAVVKQADKAEGEFISPGSDQADAVLRLEAIANQMDLVSTDFIEENISYLLAKERELEELQRLEGLCARFAEIGGDPEFEEKLARDEEFQEMANREMERVRAMAEEKAHVEEVHVYTISQLVDILMGVDNE